MLVFASDFHLTDDTLHETIDARAFGRFGARLREMAHSAKVREDIEIVLLGDIFDLITTRQWFCTHIRPWSDDGEIDDEGETLKDHALAIIERVCATPANRQAVEHLRNFRDAMARRDVSVKFTYMVGNHDRLANRYPETRMRIAQFLGMDAPGQYEDKPFPTERLWERYRAFARHGDVYDVLNSGATWDAPSWGDALMIDLMNRFPTAVESDIGPSADPELVCKLKEIGNVFPRVDIPLWIHRACGGAKSARIAQRAKAVWNDLVDDFLEMPFVREHARPWRLDAVDVLNWTLRVSKYLSFRNITRLPLRSFQKRHDDYVGHALDEQHMRRNEAEFVLYGHTHCSKVHPLGNGSRSRRDLERIYFNTGTWQTIHVGCSDFKESHEFQSSKTMTFVSFYDDDERSDRRFEVTNAAVA